MCLVLYLSVLQDAVHSRMISSYTSELHGLLVGVLVSVRACFTCLSLVVL